MPVFTLKHTIAISITSTARCSDWGSGLCLLLSLAFLIYKMVMIKHLQDLHSGDTVRFQLVNLYKYTWISAGHIVSPQKVLAIHCYKEKYCICRKNYTHTYRCIYRHTYSKWSLDLKSLFKPYGQRICGSKTNWIRCSNENKTLKNSCCYQNKRWY